MAQSVAIPRCLAIQSYSQMTLETREDRRFNDADLEQIASELEEPIERVTDDIVQHLLLNFSLNYGNLVCCLSDKLHNRYIELIQLYDDVREAVANNDSVENLFQFQQYFESISAYEPLSKAKIVEQVKIRAFQSHDLIRTFPSCCEYPDLNQIDVATQLFGIVDNKEIYDAKTVTSYLFKFIALYTEPKKYLTWNDLLNEWASLYGKGKAYLQLKEQLSLYWLTPSHIPDKNTGKDLSFKKFTFQKTGEAYEYLIQFSLDDKTRVELEQEMENEEFRLEFVFFCGNPDLLFSKGSKTTDSTKRWLLAARRMMQLNKEYKVTNPKLTQTLFNWILESSSDQPELGEFDDKPRLNEKSEKIPLDSFIAEVKRLSSIFSNPNGFLTMSFTFLMLMLEYKPETIHLVVNKIMNEQKDQFLEDPLTTFKGNLKI